MTGDEKLWAHLFYQKNEGAPKIQNTIKQKDPRQDDNDDRENDAHQKVSTHREL